MLRAILIACVCLSLTPVDLLETDAYAEEPGLESQVLSQVTENFEQLANSTQPAMEWNATTPAEHDQWRTKFRAKLVQLLGRMPQRVPLEVKWEAEQEFEKFTRHKIYVRSESDYWVPVYYFVPKDLKEKRPAIVCLHGHSGIYPYIRAGQTEEEQKKTAKLSLDYAVYFADTDISPRQSSCAAGTRRRDFKIAESAT